MTRLHRIALLLIACALAGQGNVSLSSDPPVQASKDPATEVAQAASKRIEADEVRWAERTEELARALQVFSPGVVNLAQERPPLATLREYVKKLQQGSGEVVVKHERWAQASEALLASLRSAPKSYQAAAELHREFAAEARFAANRDQYLLLAETWEDLARQAEQRVKGLDLDTNKDGLVDFLKEAALFQQRFSETLDALPHSADPNSPKYSKMIANLSVTVGRYGELRAKLELLRDKVGSEAVNNGLRDRVTQERRIAKLKRLTEDRDREREKAAKDFLAEHGLLIRAVVSYQGWINAPAKGSLRVGERLTYYKPRDHGVIDPAGTLEIVSYYNGSYEVRQVGTYLPFPEGRFACPSAVKPPVITQSREKPEP
jgi:hypothetical protein